MPVPQSAVGRTTEPLEVTVDRGLLQLFATATGQTDPVYLDVEAARAQGHPDLLVPPTYLFGLELQRPEPFGWLADLGVDLNDVLHGSQSFRYERPVHAGDRLTVHSTLTGVSTRKGGALELLDRTTEVTRDDGRVAVLQQTIVVVHEVAA